MSKREFAAKLSEVTVHERIFGNWAIPLATYRSLETVSICLSVMLNCLRLPSRECSIRTSLPRKAPRSETSGICFRGSRQQASVWREYIST